MLFHQCLESLNQILSNLACHLCILPFSYNFEHIYICRPFLNRLQQFTSYSFRDSSDHHRVTYISYGSEAMSRSRFWACGPCGFGEWMESYSRDIPCQQGYLMSNQMRLATMAIIQPCDKHQARTATSCLLPSPPTSQPWSYIHHVSISHCLLDVNRLAWLLFDFVLRSQPRPDQTLVVSLSSHPKPLPNYHRTLLYRQPNDRLVDYTFT